MAYETGYTVRGVGGNMPKRQAGGTHEAGGKHEAGGTHHTGGKHEIEDAKHIDVGNSGTTLRLFTAIAALSSAAFVFNGDAQTRARPMGSLLTSLVDLGAEVLPAPSPRSHAPFTIRGPLSGGHTDIACPTSQYLTALLFAAPCAHGDTTIVVTHLEERPYIDITLQWLRRCGIRYHTPHALQYHIPGGQRYRPFHHRVEGDYSSATFLICAAVLAGRAVQIDNLSHDSVQGDRRVVDVLCQMGAKITVRGNALIIPSQQGGTAAGGGSNAVLRGGRFDLNDIPDALPALMVCACFARQTVVIHNVAHARIKETDRIATMSAELRKMGGRIAEHPDGVTIYPALQPGGDQSHGAHGAHGATPRAPLHGARVSGHNDHRVVMALCVAALAATGSSVITNAEAAAVTYPDFFCQLSHLMRRKVKLLP